MNLHVVHNINAPGVWEKNGLAPGGHVQQWLVMECMRQMDEYLPYRSGAFRKMAFAVPDGVVYIGPMARFLYYGKVMVGIESGSAWAKPNEPKKVTSKDLDYYRVKNPLAGPFWDKRMWADHKDDILKSLPIGEKK